MLIAALAVTPSAVSSTISPRPNQWCAGFSHIFQDMSRVADILNKNAQLVLMSLPPPLASVRLLRVKNTQSEIRFSFRMEIVARFDFIMGLSSERNLFTKV